MSIPVILFDNCFHDLTVNCSLSGSWKKGYPQPIQTWKKAWKWAARWRNHVGRIEEPTIAMYIVHVYSMRKPWGWYWGFLKLSSLVRKFEWQGFLNCNSEDLGFVCYPTSILLVRKFNWSCFLNLNRKDWCFFYF